LGKDIYSVIGQGRVEEIINSKPEERREIFEEAAGILKYKLRKKEARRRLEETRENLVRVQDLIYELETQVEPLAAQAEVTRRYRTLKEQAGLAEQQLLAYRLKLSQADLDKVEKQLLSAAGDLSEAGARGGLREEQLQKLKQQTEEQARAGAGLEKELNQLSRELEQREGQLRLLQERENRFRDQQDQANQRLKQLAESQQQLADREQELQQQRRLKREAIAREQEICRGLRQSLADLENSSLVAEVEEQQARLFQARSKQEAAAAALHELTPQMERLAQRRQELERESAGLKGKLSNLAPRRKDLLQQQQQLRDQLSTAASRHRELSQERERLQQSLGGLQQQEQQRREELRGVESRLQLLQEQEAGLSGYYRGVREVLQAGPSLPGIVGPVVDLLSVEDRYLRAAETALGGGLQFIVTQTEAAAKEAIRFLKEGNRGWATFLPLDTIRATAPGPDRHPGWRDQAGVIGKASELLEVAPAYRKAVDYLLGAIVICSDLEAASRTARFLKHSCRVISLDGDVINPGGSIRGGSVPRRNAGQPLGRRKEIEALEREQSALQDKQRSGAEKTAGARQKLQRCEEDLRAAAARQSELAEQSAGLQRTAESLDQEEDLIADSLRKSGAALQQLQAEVEELKRRRESQQDKRRAGALEMDEIQAALEGKKELYQRSLSEKKELDAALTEALVSLSSGQEREQSLSADAQKLEEERRRLALERQTLEQEAVKYSGGLEECRAEQQRISAGLQKQQQQSARLMAELDIHKKQANRTRSQVMELEEEEKRGRNRVGRLEKRERQLALEQTSLKAAVGYQRLRYRELFGSAEPIEPEPGFDPTGGEEALRVLQEDLAEMGEVNLGAIEELDRLQDRITFLHSQRDDLHKGELSLRKVLAEIDQRMAYFFTGAFESISRGMQQVYGELFEGGQVLLKLTDPDNVLDSGIEIIAQPPGKKLQNISLLSTGEKVLTAVALLFAILNYKPAPFYILDEVESALDDSNLGRFIKYLKQSSREAQFVLITHRKRTMEGADVLFGVTMPEPGVSAWSR
jgi:chromosome segregation protein